MMKINGKELSEKILQALRFRVDKLQEKGITPHLAVILIGQNPASVAYVKQKEKRGAEIGAAVTILRYDETVTTEALEKKVQELSFDKTVHGILIQRPVPPHIDIEKLVELTDPRKDLDGFHRNSPFILPVALSVVKILEEIYKSTQTKSKNFSTFSVWLRAQNTVILGKGPAGGGPVINYFKKLDLPFQIIDSKTQNPDDMMKQADIIVTCVGRENLVKPEMLKKGVILIGVGIFRGLDGKLQGDYDEEKIENIASFYTPTPGGVGPVNVAMLMENLLKATEHQTS
jgi:methylenetetrahydrofolate dehydrogenase (NADP+) / methenyltetrahydrofolate cyclohydrolase